MKFLSICAAALVLTMSQSAQALDSLKILHTGGRSGTTALVANEYAAEFRKHIKTVEAQGPGGCLPVLNSAKSEKGPVLILWDSGLLPNDECKPEFTKQPSVAAFAAYFFLCTNAENSLTLADFLRGQGRVGLVTPFGFWDRWFKDLGALNNVKYNTLPVGDSGRLVLSLLSKETDWAPINGQRAHAQMKDKKLRCVATMNPQGEAGLPYLGSVVKGFDRAEIMAGWGAYVINASSDDKKKIEKMLLEIHRSGPVAKFFQENNFVDHTNSAEPVRRKFMENMITVNSAK